MVAAPQAALYLFGMTVGPFALTEKEKQALRLLGQGHDAKSIARELGLSVHTINERMREARRKMATSSSREAARLLREAEAAAPEFSGDRLLGADTAAAPAQISLHQTAGRIPRPRSPWLIGAITMSTVALALALAALVAPEAVPAGHPAAAAADAPTVTAARSFLALIDADDWDASWDAIGQAIRSGNTKAVWTSVSNDMRAKYGKPGKRELVSVDLVPAPPHGYTVVKFRTDYARKAGAIETLSMAREGDGWRVAGIMID